MDPSSRDRFKNLIQESLASVTKDIEVYKNLSKPISPDNAIGRVSRMEAIADRSVSEANLRKAQSRLQALKGALSRIEMDEFGLCMSCEEEISQQRLEILPESILCMNCLRKNED